MPKLTAIATLALTFALAAAAWAQDAPPCRVPELQRLAFYAGAWNVRFDTRLAAQGPWEYTAGSSRVDAEMRGCLLVERLQTTRQGKPMEALSVITWDHQSSRWQLTWTDSDHGMQLLFEGSAVPTGIDFRMPRNVGDRTLTLRRLLTIDGTNGVVWESARSTDNGATWDVTGRARYSRRPGAGQ